MSVRSDAITRLSEVVNTASINGVVVANESLDMAVYTASQTPLVEIVPAEETPEYEVGKHALWRTSIRLTIYYLEVRGDEAQQETLTTEIKNALGKNPTLETAAGVPIVEIINILSITPAGEFPLFQIIFDLELEYEKHIENA